MIEKRVQKYIKHGEHKKVDDGNIDNYLKRKNKNPRIKHFQSNKFPLVITASNYDDYENFAQALGDSGVTENDLRHAHVKDLKKSVEDINQLGIVSLEIDEYYVHANEKGVSHLYARMLLDAVEWHGNPSGKYDKVLHSHYNDKYIKRTMERFRADTMIMVNLHTEIDSLIQEKELSNDQLYLVENDVCLTRTQGPIFQNQQVHINHAEKESYEKKKRKIQLEISTLRQRVSKSQQRGSTVAE